MNNKPMMPLGYPPSSSGGASIGVGGMGGVGMGMGGMRVGGMGSGAIGTPTSSMSMTRMSDYEYEGSDQLLSKLKIQQLVGQIDPKERLEPEVENV
jgi:hypothetical protein